MVFLPVDGVVSELMWDKIMKKNPCLLAFTWESNQKRKAVQKPWLTPCLLAFTWESIQKRPAVQKPMVDTHVCWYLHGNRIGKKRGFEVVRWMDAATIHMGTISY